MKLAIDGDVEDDAVVVQEHGADDSDGEVVEETTTTRTIRKGKAAPAQDKVIIVE